MRSANTLLLCAAALAAAASCGAPGITPTATVTAVTPDQLTPADDLLDDLTITVAYEDGDGDLGGGLAEVHDCRADAIVSALAIPPIAPDPVEGDRPISGTLELHVNDVGAVTAGPVPPACAELGIADVAPGEAVFCVVLVDAADHRGDGDCTQAVTLTE